MPGLFHLVQYSQGSSMLYHMSEFPSFLRLNNIPLYTLPGSPGSSAGKESTCNAGDLGSIPGLGWSPGWREWLPTPVFWPGEFHEQRRLAGYSTWGSKESDMTFTFMTVLGQRVTKKVSLMAQMGKNLPVMQETWVQSLGQGDPLEKGMATNPSILAWRISCSEEPGGLQSMGSRRVRHDWVTNTFTLAV